MTDIPLQPGNGSALTRATDPVRRKGVLGCYWLCYCGRFLFLRVCDYARRPERCRRCAIKRTRIPLHHINAKASITPFYKMVSR